MQYLIIYFLTFFVSICFISSNKIRNFFEQLISQKNKNVLKTIWASNWPKIKNVEAQKKFRRSYKNVYYVYHLEFTQGFPLSTDTNVDKYFLVSKYFIWLHIIFLCSYPCQKWQTKLMHPKNLCITYLFRSSSLISHFKREKRKIWPYWVHFWMVWGPDGCP